MIDAPSRARLAHLEDRGAVAVTGHDAVVFLQGLLTNDVAHLGVNAAETAHAAAATHAALLTPQGKILFDFLVVRTPSGFVLEVARDAAPALVKRLTMYKLRAAVDIKDVSDAYHVLALWGPHAVSSGPTIDTLTFDDPRDPALGKRILAEARFARDIASATNGERVPASAYHAHRIARGVPEGGKDYTFGDTYPHEADFDLFHGVSFTKGCYVGQEVVSRMQNKTVVRKRVVKVAGADPLTPGAEVMFGDVAIGKIGGTDGAQALAMLRLDRALEARQTATPLIANTIALTVDTAALDRYRASHDQRPAAPDFT